MGDSGIVSSPLSATTMMDSLLLDLALVIFLEIRFASLAADEDVSLSVNERGATNDQICF